MKYIIQTLIATTLAFALTAQADVTKGGYAACTSEQAFEEFVSAQVSNDERSMEYLLRTEQCVVTRPGVPITVLDFGWFGTSKVRVYGENGRSVVVWTNTENIKRD